VTSNANSDFSSEKSKSTIIPLHLILPITAIGTFMSALDGSIVNVSLVTIKNALNTDMEGIRFIVIAYLLVISCFISIAGMLGDNYGRKKVFQLGMGLFILGSVFCAVSVSLEMLVISRVIQAIGGAGLTANGLALVITYVKPAIRGRAIGLNSLVVASALSSGPVIGGFLSEYIGWTSIFIINIPIGLIGILLVQRKIPETPRKDDIKIDYLGMILFIVAAFSFVGGVLYIFKDSLLGGFLISISVIFGVVFIYVEINTQKPMISIKIMKDRTILAGIFSSFLCYMVYYGMVFLLPFFYQEVFMFSQTQTGILMIVPPIAMAVMGPIAGLFSEKIEIRKLASFGAFLLSFFVFLLALTINLDLFIIIPLVALSAGALTIFTVSNGTSVMNAAPKSDVSIVSGLIGLSRNIGFTLGTTLTSAFFGLFFIMYNPNEISSGQVFTSSYYQSLESTYIIFALLALLGAGISLLRNRKNKD
jgi:EmrB/QacA subfamily drug resistance transporter